MVVLTRMGQLVRRRRNLWHKQDGRCWYCSGRTWEATFDRTFMEQVNPPFTVSKKTAVVMRDYKSTMEHCIRRVDKEKFSTNTYVMACSFCNNTRRDMDCDIWKEWMKELTTLGIHPVANFKVSRQAALEWQRAKFESFTGRPYNRDKDGLHFLRNELRPVIPVLGTGQQE